MRIAIFGCGSIGRRHARNLVALGHRDLCVYDTDVNRVREVAAELSVDGASTPGEVWAGDPHVVVVATPPALHAQQALDAARRGCDLFVEKPLAHSRAGLGELLGEARSRNLVTLVGCNMRFHPGPAMVKRLIDDGRIGEVMSARLQTGSYLPAWRPAQDYRRGYGATPEQGGAILECIHEIDLALWYFGPGRLKASATRPAASLGLAVEGLAELLLEHQRGVLSSVHLNFVQRDYRRGCQVIGVTGTIYWDFGENAVTIRRGNDSERYPGPEGWEVNQMYIDEMAHFLACVASRSATDAPLEQGMAALDIALDARKQTTAAALGAVQ